MLDRTLAPEVKKISRVDFQKIEKRELDNGSQLAMLIAGNQPVIKLEVLFHQAGTIREQQRGSASMALRMLKEGTASYSSTAITNLFSKLGAYIEINPSFDHASLSIYCLDKHIPQILPILSEIIGSPSFDAGEWQLQQELQIAQLRLQNKRNNILASKQIRQEIFGAGHPYGRIISEQDLQVLKPAQLREFWNSNKNNFEVFLSGRPSDSTINSIQELFENRSFEAVSIENEFIDSVKSTFPSNQSVQASIRLGKRTLIKTDPDYIPLLITNHVLGGYFGSRLMKNIREDKGLTYGISSSLVPLQKESYWVLGAEVNIDNVELALAEINQEISRLADFDDVAELETAKRHMTGSFQSELNTPFSLMNRYKAVHLHGLDYSYYDRFFELLNSFSITDLKNTASQYLVGTHLEKVIIN
ncbi:MAG: pitrilysin family protein [Bacteroidota bacterium]